MPKARNNEHQIQDSGCAPEKMVAYGGSPRGPAVASETLRCGDDVKS
jgi:hypothetical protein